MSNGRKFANIIVGTEVKVSVVDSDLANKVTAIKSRLDSDDGKIQSVSNLLDTSISSIKTRLDSDDAKLQSLNTTILAGIQNLADSDLIINQLQAKINSAITNVDSDSSFLQSLNTEIGIIKTRLDSDETALQAVSILTAAAASGAGLKDSDLKVVADIRNHLDSEILFAQNITLSYTNYIYTATAGQTSFTGTDDNSATLAYTAGSIQVFMNGIKLLSPDFTATDGTTVVLTEAAGLDSQLVIVVPKLASNPVSYGPVWTSLSQQAKLTASDAASNALFGISVDIKGDYAVVGALFSKAAYIFTRSGNNWSQQAKVSSSDSGFGSFVAMSSDTNYLIVGAIGYGTGGGAFVFVRSGTSWSQQTVLVDSGVASNEEWSRVAISSDGTYAVIGSIKPNSYRGRATVFIRSGTSWSQQAQFNGVSASDNLASAVSISDNGATLALGSSLDDDADGNAGSVHVHTRSGTTWSSRTVLTASDATGSDYMGDGNKAVDISEDGTLIVAGAWNHGVSGSRYGAVYVFKYSGSSWSQAAKITPPANVNAQGYGFQVAISGNTIAVGYSTATSNNSSASAHVYTTEDESTWTLAKTFTASDIAAGMDFSHGLAIDEAGTIIVGAPGTVNTSTSPGAAYVFTA